MASRNSISAPRHGTWQTLRQVRGVILLVAYMAASAHADELVFGMSAALSGPAAELGQNVKAGVEAAFHEANQSGGIHGKMLRLVALDDGYEPSRTGPNIHALIDSYDVLAIIGDVGAPTAVVAAPIAIRSKTLFFGAYTGAGVLRKTPPDRYVINFRASYAEETEAMVDALINDLGLLPDEIAFFTQRDAYGDAAYAGGIRALKRHGLLREADVAHGRYERNTDAVENGLADILLTYPPARAVIIAGAYQPSASFIKLARSNGLDAIFLNVSFVGADPLRRALGDDGEGVVITQVVPHYDSALPIVQSYRRALASADSGATPSFASLEGYISAQILLKAVRSIKSDIDRESIVNALEDLNSFRIGIDSPLTLSSTTHQACHQVWPTVIQRDRILPLDWKSLQTRKAE